MFAIVKTGGKQYRVAENDVIVVERLGGEAGDSVAFEDILMVGDGDKLETGSPLVSGATVAGEILEQARGDKILIFKKKRRKNHRRLRGHRQDLSVVRITEILTGGKKPSGKKAAKKDAPKPEAKQAEDKPAAAKDETEAKAAPEKTEAKKAPAKKAEGKAAAPKKAAAKSGETKKAPAKKTAAKPAAKKAAGPKGDGKKE